ncbi:hypothetical protein D5S17_28610 [Pseudonocardiaceae bacterium YIM PH 21723]|nr:hypothetical protein D5S17_28610 [Pseudonocardiaceae bacterium YIM PH 21723]
MLGMTPAAFADEPVTVAGVLYGDTNDNGAFDEGEPLLGGAELHFSANGETVTATTGEDGRFEFAPTGPQTGQLQADRLPDGWAGVPSPLTIDARATDLKVRAVRPIAERLTVTGRFDRDQYRRGDTAQLSFTLTNTGRYPLKHIQPGCDRANNSTHVGHDQWTELDKGIDLAPGQTRTVTVPGVVPETADNGWVSLTCDFNPDAEHPTGGPELRLDAGVASDKRGRSRGLLYHDGNEGRETPAGVKAGLVDHWTHKVIAVGETGADGRVEFPDVPYSSYEIQVYGDWKLLRDKSNVTQVGGCTHCDAPWSEPIVPGPTRPVPQPGDSAYPAAATVSFTRANAGWLIGGAVVLLLGSGAALWLARRKTA